MEKAMENFLASAESKALATLSQDGVLNVVPVSTIKIKNGKIILVNYFMDKTLNNILENPNIAFTAWTKLMGYQIKGIATYETEGDLFNETKNWVKEILPDRIVKGIIIITPKDIYDIAPNKDTPVQLGSVT